MASLRCQGDATASALENSEVLELDAITGAGSRLTMKSATVALRYEADASIGLGHAVRAQTLDKCLAEHSATVFHAVNRGSIATLVARGIPIERIKDIDSAEWQGLKPELTHVVVDTLWQGNDMSTAREVDLLMSTGVRVAVIDSMPPDHYRDHQALRPADVLITPYLEAHDLRPRPCCQFWFSGASFALLDAEYAHLRACRIERDSPPALLISCGGSDSDGLSARIAKRVVTTGVPINLVIGPLFDRSLRDELQQLTLDHRNLTLHQQPSSLAALIAQSGWVTGRPGLLRYEAACLGKKAIYCARGDGYKRYYRRFQALGVAEVYHDTGPAGEGLFLEQLSCLMRSTPATNLTAMHHVDGNGTLRVVQSLLQP